jgi:anaerobic selenocysteine-containing dehydrogenase
MVTDHLHICPLCEATCGLRVSVEGDTVVAVRGDEADVFSGGFICPKGTAIGELHHDPDRLRTPLVRNPATGKLAPATWDEAYEVIRTRLSAVVAESGPDAVAFYLGNPNVHNLSSTFYLPALIRAIGTVNRFTASTVDQFPKQVASALMYGTGLSVAVPDVDRTDYLLVLGANPLVSNGSMMTAPDMPGRLRALRKRGGRLVVIDPIRTRTARAADEHIWIRPGSDAFLLAAIAQVLFADGLADPGPAGQHIQPEAMTALAEALMPFTPEAVEQITDVPAATTHRLAHELHAAPRAAVYGRMGTTTTGLATADGTVNLGTIASWLIDVVNVALGSLDVPGGVMWALPVAGGPSTEGTPGVGRGATVPGRKRSRVRGLPSVFGEFPAAALAEEIDTTTADGTPVRVLVVVAGNPVVSTPDGGRLERALGQLDLMVSIDPQVTETSRHADVILPVPSPLARRHMDVVFSSLAVRNSARYSPPIFDLADDERDESDIILQLAAIAYAITSGGPEATPQQIDDLVALTVAEQAVTDQSSRAHGRDITDVLTAVAPKAGTERLLDLRIRSGPYGDGFGAFPDGLTLDRVAAAPHGIDLGPLAPRLPEVLRTRSGTIEIAAPQLLEALAGARNLLADPPPRPEFVLVGRRQLRSNNSWMHNVPTLSGGSNRCTVQLHPEDAHRIGVVDGQEVRISTTTGSVVAPAAVTDDVRPGVVCMPHGWGHLHEDVWGDTARTSPGANVNLVVNSATIDALSGTSALAGMAVSVEPA